MKNLMKSFSNFINEKFLSEDYEMENRLCNLIVLCTMIGTVIAFILSLVVNQDWLASLMILVALMAIIYCLYLSAWKQKYNLAAILVIILIDEIIFPFLYVACGGIHSGMICWFIVGLIFPFLVLKGKRCIAAFILGALTLSTCFVLEFLGYLKITPLNDIGWVEDIVQSMILVAIIFGIIFKFQATLYIKQNNSLKKREEELQDTMERLERANKAKSDFLANMSHEIRTPINAIMGMNEIILRECEDDTITQNSINIQNASENLLSIINDILDFSKIESGKMELISEKYMLSSLLNDCYNLIQMRAFNKGLSFQITNDPNIPENLEGDEIHIRQIVSNLLTNAVKYTKEGGIELNVSYEPTGENQADIIFAVRDTGVGISETDIEKLFNSFERIDERHNRTIEGTGLGLSITQRLIEQMGGKITVESIRGQGSVFTARIPQKIINKECIGEFSKRYEEYQTQKTVEYKEKLYAPSARILFVDDVKMNLTVVRGLLKKTKITLDMALSGKEALQKTDENLYDMIFLDHMMPEMDGIETLHFLRKRGNVNADTPVIALTANAIKGAEESYIKEGFNGYLSKPMHGEDLENMIIKFMPVQKLEKSPE